MMLCFRGLHRCLRSKFNKGSSQVSRFQVKYSTQENQEWLTHNTFGSRIVPNMRMKKPCERGRGKQMHYNTMRVRVPNPAFVTSLLLWP